jgi:3-oxoacyl-[acyl-carrier protein] reductase
VITGGSSGIGAALARRLAARSYRCVLLARGEERLRSLAREIDAEVEVCDVADRDAVGEVARRVAERYEAVHLLVNNAGVPGRGTFVSSELERIEEITRINYLGSVWCLRAFLPLLESGAPARVVNVVSVAGAVSGGAGGPYAATKHAQIAFSRSLRAELAPRGITVHTVNPGLTHTEGFPQETFLAHPFWRHAVVGADRVADAILSALDRDQAEIFVPGFYRLAAVLHGIAPATVSRIAARRRPSSGPERPEAGRKE